MSFMGTGAEPPIAESKTAQSPVENAAIDNNSTLADLSHELRGPLASIQTYCEILRTCPPQDEEQRALFLKTVADEARRLTRLVADLIELDRLLTEPPTTNTVPCDFSELLKRAIVEHHPLAAAKKLQVNNIDNARGTTVWPFARRRSPRHARSPRSSHASRPQPVHSAPVADLRRGPTMGSAAFDRR